MEVLWEGYRKRRPDWREGWTQPLRGRPENEIQVLLSIYERSLNSSDPELAASPEANREMFVFGRANGAWRVSRYMFNKAE